MHLFQRREAPFAPSFQRIYPLFILLLAFALRLYRLGEANFWWDEALAAWAIRKGLVGVTLWTASDVHPPLYFWALWGWAHWAGETEFGLRLLSAFMGLLTVAVVYRFGLLLQGRPTATLAALLTALSRFHIWWSQELRMYVLAGLLGTASLYCFWRWLKTFENLEDPPQRRWVWLVGYILSISAALYTLFLSAAWLIVQNLFILGVLLWRRTLRQALLWRWVAAQGAVAAVVGLWLAFSWGRMPTWSVSAPVSPFFAIQLYAVLLTSGASVEIHRYLWTLALPALALIGGGFLWVRGLKDGQKDPWAPGLLLLAILLPPIIVYLSTLPRGLFYTPHLEARYFSPFAPAFWLLLAWAVREVHDRWRLAGQALAVGLVITWCSVLPEYYGGRHLRDDLQTMVRAILSQAEPQDVVLLDSASRYPLFLYYYERFGGKSRPAFATIPARGGTLQAEDVADWLENAAPKYRRIWLAEVEAHLEDPEHLVRQALEETYVQIWSEGYAHNALYLYAPYGAAIPRVRENYTPMKAPHGGAVYGALRGWDLAVEEFRPGGTVRLCLYWERLSIKTMYLEMLNPFGQAILKRQVGLNLKAFPARERVDIGIPDVLPPGRYALRLVSDEEEISVQLAEILVKKTLPLPLAAGPSIGTELLCGDALLLEGIGLPGIKDYQMIEIHPKDRLVIDLYWRALRPPNANYTMFVHLVGTTFNPRTQGPVWGQHDAPPMEGQWPTSTWHSGDALVDRHVISIDPSVPEGDYFIEIGIYESETLRRLPITDRNGQWLGDSLNLGLPVRVAAP